MYTPDEMELIHREVMRLRAGGKPNPEPEDKGPSEEEERRASLIALSIIIGLVAFAMSVLFFFWDEREQMISMLRNAVYVLIGILGVISLGCFIRSQVSKDLEVRVFFHRLSISCFYIFAFALLLFVSTNAMVDSVNKELKQMESQEFKRVYPENRQSSHAP